jgi:hypothetical protein
MAKGKKSIPIDEQVLRTIISDLEDKEKFDNQSALFKRVAQEYTAKTGISVTHGVIYLRIKQFKIELKTKKSKLDPTKFRERINNAIQSNDDSIKPTAKQTVGQLLLYADAKEKLKYEKLAKSVLRGSRKAAIKLNCLACANFQSAEVRECQVNTCPMYLYRPYQ